MTIIPINILGCFLVNLQFDGTMMPFPAFAFFYIAVGYDISISIANINRNCGVVFDDRHEKINICIIVCYNQLTFCLCPYGHFFLLFFLK